MGKCAAVFDFDGTFTRKCLISLFKVVEQRALSKEYIMEMDKLREKYMPKAQRGVLTRQEGTDWLLQSIGVLIKAGLTMQQIEFALADVRLRYGVVECLEELSKRGSAVAVISYGVTQFIETVLKNDRALHLVDRIYATYLKIDPAAGLVVGYESSTVVIPEDKGLVSCDFAKSVGVDENMVFAVGDTLGDSCLGVLRENRCGIIENEKDMESMSRVMGHVVMSQDFYSVTQWLLSKIDSGEKA